MLAHLKHYNSFVFHIIFAATQQIRHEKIECLAFMQISGEEENDDVSMTK